MVEVNHRVYVDTACSVVKLPLNGSRQPTSYVKVKEFSGTYVECVAQTCRACFQVNVGQKRNIIV
jgi:hypothetical protein